MNTYLKKTAKVLLPIICVCCVIFTILFCISKYTYNKIESKFAEHDISFVAETEFSWNGIFFKNATLTFPNKSNLITVNKITIRSAKDIDLDGVNVIGDANYLLSFINNHHKQKESKNTNDTAPTRLIVSASNISGKLNYNNIDYIFKNCKYEQYSLKHLDSCIVTSNIVDFELRIFNIDFLHVHVKNIRVKNQAPIVSAQITSSAYRLSIPSRYLDVYRKVLANNKFGENSFLIHIDFVQYNNVILENISLNLGLSTAIVSIKKSQYKDISINNILASFYDDTKTISFNTSSELLLKNNFISNEEVSFGKIKVNGIYDLSAEFLKFKIIKGKLLFLISFLKDEFSIQNSSLTTCQDFIDELPAQFKPIIGPYADQKQALGYFKFNIQGKSLDDFHVELSNQCRFNRKVGQNEIYYKMYHPYINEYGAFGQGTADWVPLNLISHYVEKTVIFNEDAGFWSHSGFSNIAIRDSIRENIKAGKFVRGASTISMQLAKNLYLNRDKNLARKVEEVFLTSHLESNLSKHQIMELYLNIAQFGADIYGIKQAAKYYFNTTPMKLTLRQSMFLALLLPNPKARMMANGTATTVTREKISRLLRVMRDRGHILNEEIEEGADEAWCDCG